MIPFLLREYISAGSLSVFIQKMEELETFQWLEDKRKMRYVYTGDVSVEIDLLTLFRDYQIEKILKR